MDLQLKTKNFVLKKENPPSPPLIKIGAFRAKVDAPRVAKGTFRVGNQAGDFTLVTAGVYANRIDLDRPTREQIFGFGVATQKGKYLSKTVTKNPRRTILMTRRPASRKLNLKGIGINPEGIHMRPV